jgi:hypothetical protein
MRNTVLLTAIFILAASMQLYADQPCSLKTVKVQMGFDTINQQVYDPLPCVLTDKTGSASDNTTPRTSLDSIPQGADIIINGVVIAETPAILILEQHYTQTPFIIFFRKDGYSGGSITVKSFFAGKVQLQPTSSPQPPPPPPQPPQTTPFEFGSVRLGMSITEFKAAGPVPVPVYAGMPHGARPLNVEQTKCSPYLYGVGRRPVAGVTSCSHDLVFRGSPFSVNATFVDGKLAYFEVVVFMGVDAGERFRQRYPSFLPELSRGFGQPKQFGEAEPATNAISQYYALRWENDSSVTEYQDAWCIPSFSAAQGGGPIWSKQITELLEGSYCNSNGTSNNDTDDPRQAVVLYLHKELGNVLRARMVRNEGGVTN